MKEKLLISREDINKRIEELGRKISEDYLGKEPILICILKGAVYFAIDLTRHLTIPFIIDFMSISKYSGSSSGVVRITKDLDVDIYGKDVIVIEDIVDTGLTLGYLLRNLKVRGPSSLKVCTLLDCPSRRIVDISVDYRGFEIPDVFVVGYGLDYRERYRNLLDIVVLEE
ncbi:MAG: hypoxanthine phosphoribosyltransferase [bacterium]